jgi:NAD(P)-dependent dehydrogenase (short-subunit alcohol dehydrogenase family)
VSGAGRVALVTGAAGAIGAGICKGLLQDGCRVAASDVAAEPLDGLVRELQACSAASVMGVVMDVTDEASVAAGFDSIAQAWGRVDIVVVNAGIALACPLVDMDLAAFRKVQRVNVDGALLTLREAGRRMRDQGGGGDIVLISTKNVFMPGAGFGAYSATKAAAHQLARIASQEFAAFGVRVNMVAPDAVFGDAAHKSGLWTAVGPGRMQARGLDEKGLEEYYRTRNLLKERVTAEHVANAVRFFVTHQTPTTGATLPVDGGLPDSTPR